MKPRFGAASSYHAVVHRSNGAPSFEKGENPTRRRYKIEDMERQGIDSFKIQTISKHHIGFPALDLGGKAGITLFGLFTNPGGQN